MVQPETYTLGLKELRERSIDLVLARLPRAPVTDDLAIEPLLDDQHRVVVGNSNPLARRRIRLADLIDEPWIFPPNHVVHDMIGEAFAAEGLAIPAEHVDSSSILLRFELLETGRYVTVLTDSVLRHGARHWPIKVLPIDLQFSPRPLSVLTLKNRTLSPAVRLFIDHLRAVARTLSIS